MLTRFNSLTLALVVAAIIFGATGIGIVIGRVFARRRVGLKEPLGVVQAALIGFVALLLVRSHDGGRTIRITANQWCWTPTRSGRPTCAETLAEPMRTESLSLLRRYADAHVALSESVPDSAKFQAASETSVELQGELWALAVADRSAPTASAPRLYIETLNEMIDAHTTWVAAPDNRIPASVLWLQILASALALCVLGMFLASHDRGVLMPLLAAGLVTVLLLVIFDLDRPHRGLITVPDAPLTALRNSMNEPPAATGPP